MTTTARMLAISMTLGAALCPAAENLLTFGFPDNIEIEYGHVSFGAEAPRVKTDVAGPGFPIRGLAPGADGVTIVYGLKRGETNSRQVWRAETRDAMTFTNEKMLFELPATRPRWLVGDVVLRDGTLFLLQSQLGSPPRRGHPFHLFSGPLAGGEWRKLNEDAIYRGQDSFNIVWNRGLERFVNYQISYQPWDKPFRDNMPDVRRVLHIRTSPDALTWTPGESFGADGPYLSEEQLIVPDEEDSPDTEFYRLNATHLGEFWLGAMVKYVTQPPELPKHGNWPHGPFLGYEWWISKDGLNWQRPFRESSALDHTPRAFLYSLCEPLMVGDEMRWFADESLFTLDRRRFLYAYSRANARILTRPLRLSGEPIRLNVSFESVRRDVHWIVRQGYLMAELVDEDGVVIPGFERENCLFEPDESRELTLRWGERRAPDDLSEPVRLRLYFRDLRLYTASY